MILTVTRSSELDTPDTPYVSISPRLTRRKCRNPNCQNTTCTCARHSVRRSKSQRLPRNKPPRHVLKPSRSAVLVPPSMDREDRPIVDNVGDEYGVTLHVPSLPSSTSKVTLNSKKIKHSPKALAYYVIARALII